MPPKCPVNYRFEFSDDSCCSDLPDELLSPEWEIVRHNRSEGTTNTDVAAKSAGRRPAPDYVADEELS